MYIHGPKGVNGSKNQVDCISYCLCGMALLRYSSTPVVFYDVQEFEACTCATPVLAAACMLFQFL